MRRCAPSVPFAAFSWQPRRPRSHLSVLWERGYGPHPRRVVPSLCPRRSWSGRACGRRGEKRNPPVSGTKPRVASSRFPYYPVLPGQGQPRKGHDARQRVPRFYLPGPKPGPARFGGRGVFGCRPGARWPAAGAGRGRGFFRACRGFPPAPSPRAPPSTVGLAEVAAPRSPLPTRLPRVSVSKGGSRGDVQWGVWPRLGFARLPEELGDGSPPMKFCGPGWRHPVPAVSC